MELKKKKHAAWFYEVAEVGLNYRISDVQCALGNSQLKKIDIKMKKRTKIAKFYENKFYNLKHLSIPCLKKRDISANHLFVIKIDFKKKRLTRTQFCKKLLKKNIGTQLHYIPIPLHKSFKKKGYNLNELPNTKDYYEKAISIPIFVSLNLSSQKNIIKEIKKILKEN